MGKWLLFWNFWVWGAKQTFSEPYIFSFSYPHLLSSLGYAWEGTREAYTCSPSHFSSLGKSSPLAYSLCQSHFIWKQYLINSLLFCGRASIHRYCRSCMFYKIFQSMVQWKRKRKLEYNSKLHGDSQVPYIETNLYPKVNLLTEPLLYAFRTFNFLNYNFT